MKKIFQTLFKAALLIPLLSMTNIASAENVQPSGTLSIEETQFALGIGGELGGGKLSFGSDQHDFKIGGFQVGSVGIEKTSASGSVYYLNDIADFSGTYFAIEGGLTIGGGVGGTWMKNDKGVTIHLVTTSEGVEVQVGTKGVTISMN